MKLRQTLILLAAVVAAALVAYALSRKPPSDEAAGARLLPALQAQDVNSLTIEQAGPRIVCRRQDGDWRLVEPLDARADAARIGHIVAGFEAARSATSIAASGPVALTRYGLDKPTRTVTLGSQASVVTVRFGAPLPVGDMVYAAVDGRDGIFAVPAELARSADVTPADLRSDRLAPPINAADLRGLAISASALGQTPGFALECRRAGDHWELTAPVSDLADGAAVAAVADAVSSHRVAAGDFAAGSPGGYGLDSPALTVTLTATARTETLLFSRRADGCYALLKGESAPVRVPQELFDALRRPPADLRDRALARVEARDVTGIELSGPAGTLTLARQGDGWVLSGERPAAADGQVVTNLLGALTTARAKDFPADRPADLRMWGLSDDARTRLTLRGAGGRALADVALGTNPQTGDLCAVRLPYAPVLLLGKDGPLAVAFAGRLGFLDRTVLREPAAGAVQVELRNAGSSFRAAFDEATGQWRLLEPVTAPADERAVRDVLSDFSDLRVQAFAAERAADPAAYGLDKPQATVTVTYRTSAGGAAATRTLRIGAPTGQPAGGCYAALDGDERVLVLADGVADHFRRNLASKAICRAAEATALTFRAGRRSAEFAYDAAARTWTGPAGAPLAQPAAKALGDVVALLHDFEGRALADYVPKAPALYGFDAPYLEVELGEATGAGKRIVIGKPAEGGGRYACGPVTDFVLIADDADVAKLRAVLDAGE